MQMTVGAHVSHPSEIENRIAYATRVVAFLDRHLPTARAANIAVMNQASWDRIADLAGENHPSKASINMITGMIVMRESIVAQAATVSGPTTRLLSKLETVDPDEGRT